MKQRNVASELTHGVAPLAGAWIETVYNPGGDLYLTRRAPRGRVD